MKDFHRKELRNQRTVLLKNMRKRALHKARKGALRQKVIRRFAAGLGAAAVTAAGAWGVYAALASSSFRVKEITFQGNTHLEEGKLRSYEQRMARNIFRLDLAAIRRDLLQEPYVRDVLVRRELPDRIHIHIRERVPFVVLRTEKAACLVDREGRVLETVADPEAQNLPVVSARVQDRASLPERDLSEALSLVETLRRYGYPDLSEIREIEIAGDGGVVLHPRDARMEILCGTRDYLHKMMRLKWVAADLARRGWPIRAIDLRFEDQVVVRTDRPVRVS